MVRNLRARLGEVGAVVGRRYRASTFGVLGYALLASRTVHEAMNVALRFLDLSNTFAIPRAELDGPRVRIVVDGTGLPADVRRFLVERDTAAIRAVLAELAGLSMRERQGRRPLRWSSTSPSSLDRSARGPRRVGRRRGGVPRRRREAPGAPGVGGQVRVLVTQQLPGVRRWTTSRPARRQRADPAPAVGGGGTTYQRLLDEVRGRWRMS